MGERESLEAGVIDRCATGQRDPRGRADVIVRCSLGHDAGPGRGTRAIAAAYHDGGPRRDSQRVGHAGKHLADHIRRAVQGGQPSRVQLHRLKDAL